MLLNVKCICCVSLLIQTYTFLFELFSNEIRSFNKTQIILVGFTFKFEYYNNVGEHEGKCIEVVVKLW